MGSSIAYLGKIRTRKCVVLGTPEIFRNVSGHKIALPHYPVGIITIVKPEYRSGLEDIMQDGTAAIFVNMGELGSELVQMACLLKGAAQT